MPAARRRRASIVVGRADGEAENAIAPCLALTGLTFGPGGARFIERRMAGLCGDLRPDKPRTIDADRMAHAIWTTPHTGRAHGSAHRGLRAVATERCRACIRTP